MFVFFMQFCFFLQGIERLKRKQLISDELKEALKPFYRHKEISKDDYKYIYGRAFEKVGIDLCENFNTTLFSSSMDIAYYIMGKALGT